MLTYIGHNSQIGIFEATEGGGIREEIYISSHEKITSHAFFLFLKGPVYVF